MVLHAGVFTDKLYGNIETSVPSQGNNRGGYQSGHWKVSQS